MSSEKNKDSADTTADTSAGEAATTSTSTSTPAPVPPTQPFDTEQGESEPRRDSAPFTGTTQSSQYEQDLLNDLNELTQRFSRLQAEHIQVKQHAQNMEERNKHLLNLAEQRAMQADTLQATIDQIPKSDLLAKLVIDQNK